MRFEAAMMNRNNHRSKIPPAIVCLALAMMLVSTILTRRRANAYMIGKGIDLWNSSESSQLAPVAKDEFWLSDNDDEVYLPFNFEFVDPLVGGNGEYGRLERMWNCSDSSSQDRSTKLIFVHISRTAGNTHRNLLFNYSSECKASFVFVKGCAAPSWNTLVKDSWASDLNENNERKRCIVELAKDRSGDVVNRRGINSAFLKPNVDILVGRLPLGVHQYWTQDAQYVVFLRQPMDKFVSRMISYAKEMQGISDVSKIIRLIRHKMELTKMEDEEAYFDEYSRYLITPEQHAWLERDDVDITFEESSNLSLKNLVESKILIGIFERMSESYEMLEYILDGKGELKAMFDMSQEERAMENAVSTQYVIEELKKDKELYDQIENFLKYETKIYTQAVELHKRQYEWLQRQQEG